MANKHYDVWGAATGIAKQVRENNKSGRSYQTMPKEVNLDVGAEPSDGFKVSGSKKRGRTPNGAIVQLGAISPEANHELAKHIAIKMSIDSSSPSIVIDYATAICLNSDIVSIRANESGINVTVQGLKTRHTIGGVNFPIPIVTELNVNWENVYMVLRPIHRFLGKHIIPGTEVVNVKNALAVLIGMAMQLADNSISQAIPVAANNLRVEVLSDIVDQGIGQLVTDLSSQVVLEAVEDNITSIYTLLGIDTGYVTVEDTGYGYNAQEPVYDNYNYNYTPTTNSVANNGGTVDTEALADLFAKQN